MNEFTRVCCGNQSLFLCFTKVSDPRLSARCTYPLFTILIIVLCGLIAGCDNWKSVELFAIKRKRLLSRLLDLSEGIPSSFTLARVFSLIDPHEFESCFREWINQISQLLTYDIVSIDGKTVRGSGHKAGNKKASHIVNAYDVFATV